MRQFCKVNGERTNISMSLDAARREPVLIEFFGNQAVMFSAERFLDLTPDGLRRLQRELMDASMAPTPAPASYEQPFERHIAHLTA